MFKVDIVKEPDRVRMGTSTTRYQEGLPVIDDAARQLVLLSGVSWE